MTSLPLDEILAEVDAKSSGNYSPQYVFIPLDQRATAKILEMNPGAYICEVQLSASNKIPHGLGENKVKDVLVQSARVIYKENPNSSLVFCYTLLGYFKNVPTSSIPEGINKYLPDITRKIVLYIGDDQNDSTLERLLGVR